jgi:dTDP-4-dehydrorhamnose 3,5-epimerase
VELPDGVELVDLSTHPDARGDLTELWRTDSSTIDIKQVNVVHSVPNVLRGVHVHLHHWDHLVVLDGRGLFALRDVRSGSPTDGLTTTVWLDGASPQAIVIPPGVAHGFWFPDGATHLYGLTKPWDVSDDIGCRWDAPGLGIDWGVTSPILSARDAASGSLEAMIDAYRKRAGTS